MRSHRRRPQRPTVTVDGETIVGHEIQGPDLSGYHVRVSDWNGDLVYEGPCPVPAGVAEVSIEDALAGRLFQFEMKPPS